MQATTLSNTRFMKLSGFIVCLIVMLLAVAVTTAQDTETRR